jgi:hypothetical protein
MRGYQIEPTDDKHELEWREPVRGHCMTATPMRVKRMQVLEYVRTHPGCTQIDLRNALGIPASSAKCYLHNLELSGHLTHTGTKLGLWHTREALPFDDMPIRGGDLERDE